MEKPCFVTSTPKFASARIRAFQIAEKLGLPVFTDTQSIPRGYNIFITVKVNEQTHCELYNRGLVIWDAIDGAPPEQIHACIVSSPLAATHVKGKPVFVIPQHHCNFRHRPLPIPTHRRAKWIGHKSWSLSLPIPHEAFVLKLKESTLSEVVGQYRSAGILLNFRNRQNPSYKQHLIWNGGIKLINACAFGIPSISEPEPVFKSLLPEACTLYASISTLPEAYAELARNETLYNNIRKAGLQEEPKYRLTTIVELYRDMLHRIVA